MSAPTKTDFTTTCSDYQPKTGPLRQGCGKQIVMKVYPDGYYHPHNLDGTPHKHAAERIDAKPATTINNQMTVKPANGNKERGYYEGIPASHKTADEAAVNAALAEGWEIIKTFEEQGVTIVEEEVLSDLTGAVVKLKKPVPKTTFYWVLGKRGGASQ